MEPERPHTTRRGGPASRWLRVLFLVVGFGLAGPGLLVTGFAIWSALPYLRGDSCSMDAIGLLVLPVSVPALVLGALLLWVARRS